MAKSYEVSDAYVIGSKDKPYKLPNGQEWYQIRMSVGIVDKSENIDQTKKCTIPDFTLVATDKKSAKKQINLMVDSLFNSFDKNE